MKGSRNDLSKFSYFVCFFSFLCIWFFSFFQKITSDDLALSTPIAKARSYRESEIPYLKKKCGKEYISPSKGMFTEVWQSNDANAEAKEYFSPKSPKRQSNDVNAEAKEYFSPKSPKRPKTEIKLLKKDLGVKDLLRTGRLEGLPVMYMKKDVNFKCLFLLALVFFFFFIASYLLLLVDLSTDLAVVLLFKDISLH